MKWKSLTYDFDKGKQIYKVRFDISGSSINIPSSTNQNCFFAESPNINCDGMNYSNITGATYGYAGRNRFGIRDNIFSSRYYNFTDERWTAHTHTTAVTSAISEYNCPVALYYAGATAYNDSTLHTVLAGKVSVYVEVFKIDKDSIEFNCNSGSTTVDVSSDRTWTASTNDSWITLSETTGSGDATITVSVAYNPSYSREGIIEFYDGEETLTLTVTQAENRMIPVGKLYINGDRIN